MPGRLFVVATPIGNLRDITLRALDVLREAPLVAAEDTRRTQHLLRHHGMQTRLTSYHEHNKLVKLPLLLSALQRHDVALVTDAGSPGVSDPGADLVAAAAAAGVPIVAIPGPSALAAAVSVAGMPAEEVHFMGFLPRRRGERRQRLAEAARWRGMVALFEAPHRLRDTLADLHDALGDRTLVVARELTKLHEEVLHTTVAAARRHFEAEAPRGEFTLVVAGAPKRGSATTREQRPEGEASPATPARLRELLAEAGSLRAALARASKETGLPRKQLYRLLLEANALGGRRDDHPPGL